MDFSLIGRECYQQPGVISFKRIESLNNNLPDGRLICDDAIKVLSL
ncbi:hypothetical protein SAMN06296273_0313 [Nitrosomonas ureae]|uniref:Uncharacterized protein n=1 Tax=Nitrosomonas ureae TaxID=44577 RepID=A0A285BVC0_9PROT|nr:hypothetical protein SAMN06296273_0313 [Nitrosomonas ureae]